MKINIYTFPFRGHIMQAVKIANYLFSQGHSVTVDTDSHYFKFLSSGIDKKATLYKYIKSQKIIDKDTLLNCAEGILLTSNNYLQEFENSTENPDIIIYDSMAYWGKLLAEKYNIDSISLITIQPFTHQNFIDNSYEYLQTYSSKFKNSQQFLRNLHIFEKVAKTKYELPDDFMFDNLLCATGSHNLVLMPKAMCKFYKDLNESFKAFSPIIDFNKKNIKKEKSIYIATGSMIKDLDFLKTCIDSLLSLKLKIYISAREFASELQQIYSNTKNVIIFNFAPQMKILQKCSVFITHGGTNSINESIYFETPMIVIPFTNDEFLNAEMVTECGIGLKINNDKNEIISKLKDYVENLLFNINFAKNIKAINEELNSNKALTIINDIIKEKKDKAEFV